MDKSRFMLDAEIHRLSYMLRALWRDLFHPGWKREDEANIPGWVCIWLDDIEGRGEMERLHRVAKDLFNK